MFSRIANASCIVVVLFLGGTAVASDQPDPLAALRSRLVAPGTPSEDRAVVLDNILRTRRQLIENQPDHPDVLFRRTAQAEDALLSGLQLNALELAVRYGLPTPNQQDTMDILVQIALDQTAAIEENLDAAIDAAQAASSRRERLEILRDSRLPFLRGMALTLAADRELVDDPESARKTGIELIQLAGSSLRGKDAVLALRQLALARLAMGEADLATDMLVELERSDLLSPLDQVGIRLALIDSRRFGDGPQRSAGEAQIAAATNTDPLERLLLIEFAARCWMEAAKAIPVDSQDPLELQDRAQLERNAVEAFLLLFPSQGGLRFEGQPRMLDLLVEDRIGRLGLADPTAPHLPDSAAIAAAKRLASSPGTAQQAREILLPLVDKPGLSPRNRARSLALLVHADANSGEQSSAIEHAIMWSQVAADRPEAQAAAELAATIASRNYEQNPGEESASGLRDRAINNLLIHFPDHENIDVWRWRSGLIAEQAGRLDAALRQYNSIGSQSPQRPYALSRLAILAVQEVPAAADPAEAIKTTREQLKAWTQELSELEQDYPIETRGARTAIDLAAAELDLLAGQPIAALDRLSSSGFSDVDSDLALPIHMARLEAAMQTNRPTAVEAVIKAIPPQLAGVVSRRALQNLLNIPGTPLPGDPWTNPTQSVMAARLASLLAETQHLDMPTEMVLIESLRRGGDTSSALQRVTVLLAANPDLGDALLSQAECLHDDPEEGRAEAIKIYTRLTRGAPEQNPVRFWTSHLRLLQLMRADGRDSGAILARLNRLQQSHPSMGGPPFQSQFEILRIELTGP